MSAAHLLLLLLALPARAETVVLLGPDGLSEAWKPLTFKKRLRATEYRWDPIERALEAVSSSSASGLLIRTEADLRRTPVLRWRWKVGGTVPGGDERARSGDDYAARVYVVFRYEPAREGAFTRVKYGLAKTLYGEYPPGRGMNYIWANLLPMGEDLPNAYTDRVRMVAVRSGPEEAGRWLEERRDLLEDWKRLFGGDPPPLAGIAVMTDTDDTRSSARAWYADLRLESRQEPAPSP